MVNSNSAIALYGFQDIPLELEAKTIGFGIKLTLFPKRLDKSNLGTQVRDVVNNTSALLILEADENLHTVVQFYFAANKNVFFIGDEANNSRSLSSGVRILPNLEEMLDELLKETESFIIDSRIGKLELRFNAFGLTYLKASKQIVTSKKLSKQAKRVQDQLEGYFDGERKNFNLQVFLNGTDFQRKTWAKLTKIPFGQTCSYGDLANKLGDNNASRAVGSGISKNPIWIVIPCHRVLSHEGELTGYAGGLKLKQYLLDLESKQMSLF